MQKEFNSLSTEHCRDSGYNGLQSAKVLKVLKHCLQSNQVSSVRICCQFGKSQKGLQ